MKKTKLSDNKSVAILMRKIVQMNHLRKAKNEHYDDHDFLAQVDEICNKILLCK